MNKSINQKQLGLQIYITNHAVLTKAIIKAIQFYTHTKRNSEMQP